MRIRPSRAPTRPSVGIRLALNAALLCAAAPAAAQPAVEIEVNQTAETRDDYIGWSPVLARIRLSQPGGAPGPVDVVLRNQEGGKGGQVAFAPFRDPWPAGTTATQDQLSLTVRADGEWVPFVVAGKYPHASSRDGDAVIQARAAGPDGAALGSRALMVRVRKDANTLSAEERARFLDVLMRLRSAGGYDVFQQMHSVAGGQAHRGPSFLPWHRAMLLAFERALQSIDPSVALPYWRFHRPAPDVFSPDFMGAPAPDGGELVQFSLTNPLNVWKADGVPGIERKPEFAPTAVPDVKDEPLTLNPSRFGEFRTMEINPHARVHTQTGGGGWLGSAPIAVNDPLFFLLHANIDRLWAAWQVDKNRFDPGSADAYAPQGATAGTNCATLGHFALDTMWPWNGATRPADQCRPSVAPGAPFPALAPGVHVPPQQPRPHDLIDYRSSAASLRGAGVSYDSIPFN